MAFTTRLSILIFLFNTNILCQVECDDPLPPPPPPQFRTSAQYHFPYIHQSFQCASECRCSPFFPFAMYCESRKLKYIPNIPAGTHYLYLQHNEIEAVPEKAFINATSLQEIHLSYNKIKSSMIDKGIFGRLKSLVHLHLEHNKLDKVPSPLPSSLERLFLGFNKISKLPGDTFHGLVNITMLNLCNNQLTDGSFKGNILARMKSLMQVNLCNNKLKSMPAELPASLLQLSVENNSISSLPPNYFKKVPHLISLRMAHNKLKEVPYAVFNLSNLLELNMGYNKLSQAFYIPRRLEHLYLNHNHFTRFNITLMCPTTDLQNPKQLTYMRVDKNMLTRRFDAFLFACFPRLQALVYGEQNVAPTAEHRREPRLFGMPVTSPDGEPDNPLPY
ncbi:osteomodulin precursor [Callorhinchus milii]|uniref:Osteomodulin n=1 Tax=Callorhinchus milii TaxID=7868 RepID=V9NEN7_CALMI|nr:osteomodulin precursor [Callorhinchus milii]AGN91181.1 osteomodulin [Callorhinchus milii]|eukprot:gi/632980506/ref/XP_007907072.1/ PREDICTED: osteomodulin [Callorhinchus milii]